MPSLIDCLGKSPLPDAHQQYIVSRARFHEEQGLSEGDAATRAIEELQEQTRTSIRSVLHQVGVKGYESISSPKINQHGKEETASEGQQGQDVLAPKEESPVKETATGGEINPRDGSSSSQNLNPTDTAQPENTTSVQTSVPQGEKVAAASGDGKTVGVSHTRLERLAKQLGFEAPKPGEYIPPAELATLGRELVQAGADPVHIDPHLPLHLRIAISRAHLEDLTRAADSAAAGGIDSKAFRDAQKAVEDYSHNVVKPLGTQAHYGMVALQGERNLEDGSFSSALNALKDQHPQTKVTPEIEEQLKKTTDELSKTKREVEILSKRLTDLIDKDMKGEDKKASFTEKAKNVADRLRKLKTKPFTFKDENGNDVEVQKMGAGWNDLVEVGAKAIEKTGELADGIKAVVDKIREQPWYQNLSAPDKERLEDELGNHFAPVMDELRQARAKRIAELAASLQGKSGKNYAPKEARGVWNHAKDNYVDKGVDFDTMINNTAMDLGITASDVRGAILAKKSTREVSNQMYETMERRAKATRMVEAYVDSGGGSAAKVLMAVPNFFFGLKVFGHGTVGMITHAGVNIMDVMEWRRYWPTFFKQFQIAYSIPAHARAMADHVRDPMYTFAKRSGLAVAPNERYDDYQFVTNIVNIMGRLGVVLTAGDRGFDALKIYRLQRFKALWKNTSALEKADENTATRIAALVNHSTGTSNIGLNPRAEKVANFLFFAHHLEASRWNKLVIDPAEALATWGKMAYAKASGKQGPDPSEIVAARIVTHRAARILSTYVASLIGNQALLTLAGSKQKINFTNPTDSDWLRFKIGDHTVEMMGGMTSTLRFVANLVQIGADKAKNVPKGRDAKLEHEAFTYVSEKASPFASTVKDVLVHHDFKGNTLPFYKDKPTGSGHRMGALEYFGKDLAPIPITEGVNDFRAQAKTEGLPLRYVDAILSALFVGGTGIHVGELPKKHH